MTAAATHPPHEFEVVRDPLWNTIRVDPTALALIDTPEFQRLRNIRQLGLAYLVYPGATHTRFDHALGVYHLARRALALLGERGKPVATLVDTLSLVLFKIMGIIIKLAPLGVLGAIAFTVGQYGIGSLKQLGMLVALYYGAVLVFVFVVLGLVMRMSGFSLVKLLRYLREELTIVFATTSSDSVLPQIMAKLRFMGIRDSTVGLVIPTGYSFNLDAFSIYITLAAVFIAQATNTPISMADLLTILAISLVTSKGAHGVPGSAIVVLAATLQAIPAIPAIGLVLVLSVDWFVGMARALGNLIGNCVATVVVAAWEGDLDHDKARRVLDGEELVDVTAG